GPALGLRPLRRVRPRAPCALPAHVPALDAAATDVGRARVLRPAAAAGGRDRRGRAPGAARRGRHRRVLVGRARRHLAPDRRLLEARCAGGDAGARCDARSIDRAAHPKGGRPMPTDSTPNPFLQGNFAPWRTEGEARDLAVIGEIPRELNGTYYRSGPKPAFPPLGPMTAHPKIDPETGEMLFFGYSPFPPYLTFHEASADGTLVRSEVIDVGWPSMMHDFAVTRDHVIFVLCPLVFSFERLAERG